MVKNTKVSVIGAGTWGTTIANIVASNVEEVILWSRNDGVVSSINKENRNIKYLPDIMLSSKIRASSSYEEALRNCDILVWAIPVQYTRDRLKECREFILQSTTVIIISKGLEEKTLYRPSQIFSEICEYNCIVGALGGPNIAKEISDGSPATATLAITPYWNHEATAEVFRTTNFKVSLSPHLISLEIAGALKNVVALASGICDGLGLGWNVKAVVIAKGYKEMQCLGNSLGASKESFGEECALGDLITSCASEVGRNRSVGQILGSGKSIADARVALNGRVAEGVNTARSCKILTNQLGISLPLLNGVHEIIEGEITAEQFINIVIQ